jgi:glycosyltransferase involved in cell wall biosynthesis
LVKQLHLRDRVLFLSNQTDAQMAALYRGCEVFITLADIEGFGLPLGEALFCGARAVASDISTHREVAGEHCEYVPARTDATAAVLQAIDRATRRGRPSSNVVAELSPAAVATLYSAVYHDLVSAAAVDETSFQELPVSPASEVQ